MMNWAIVGRRCRRRGFDSCLEKTPLDRAWQPTPVFLPGESHGQKSLVGYSLRGCKELDTTEWLTCPPSVSARGRSCHQANLTREPEAEWVPKGVRLGRMDKNSGSLVDQPERGWGPPKCWREQEAHFKHPPCNLVYSVNSQN